MEEVLSLYSLPFDELHPVVCFDELPVQFTADAVEPLPMKAGKPARFDYEYKRGGTASLLIAIEPLTGKRLVETSRRRARADYCRFLLRVAEAWGQAEKTVLVQDNLNTHTAGSFYENLPAEEAFALAQRFEMHYTPKKGSWLNMAELELSALWQFSITQAREKLGRHYEEVKSKN